jgi:hypothetical protein
VATAVVATVNVADVAPVAKITVPGTETDPASFVTVTEVPAGAGALSVTAPITVLPPVTADLFRLNVFSSGSTVRVEEMEPDQSVAISATDTAALTSVVWMLTVADVPPPGIVTCAGTTAAGLPLLSETASPPAGAMPVNVIVPVTESIPPVAVARSTVNVSTRAGVTITFAVFVTLNAVAVMVTVLSAPLKAVVVTVNVAVVALAGTVTEIGTAATGSLLESRTTKPLLAAKPVNVTVPVSGEPPPTVARESDTPFSDGGLMTNVDWMLVPANVAVIVTVVMADTGLTVTVNEADCCPLATETVAGTVALLEFDESAMTAFAMPLGTTSESVTVPVTVWPLSVVDELNPRPVSLRATTSSVVSASDALIQAAQFALIDGAEALAVTMKFALEEPAGIVMVAGIVKDGL